MDETMKVAVVVGGGLLALYWVRKYQAKVRAMRAAAAAPPPVDDRFFGSLGESAQRRYSGQLPFIATTPVRRPVDGAGMVDSFGRPISRVRIG